MTERNPGSDFSGGFFGCFGVLAAVIVLGVAVLALGQCSKPSPSPAPSKDYNRLVYASHCLNGLDVAQSKGLIASEKSALLFPWSIYREGGTEYRPVLACGVTEGEAVRKLTVEVVCSDADDESCTRFVSLSQP